MFLNKPFGNKVVRNHVSYKFSWLYLRIYIKTFIWIHFFQGLYVLTITVCGFWILLSCCYYVMYFV